MGYYATVNGTIVWETLTQRQKNTIDEIAFDEWNESRLDEAEKKNRLFGDILDLALDDPLQEILYLEV